jgi:putative ABC transport system permease protein
VSVLERQRTPIIERIFAGHHDILAALRSLRRSPGFVAIAVLSLGLAIGLNTTTFAMLDAIRNPYVPYRDPAGLFSVRAVNSARDKTATARSMYLALQDRHDLYSALVPMDWYLAVVEGSQGMERAAVAAVGRGFFDVLGVPPLMGRVFHADSAEGRGTVGAVISSALWHQKFGGATRVDGLTITIGGIAHPVIGVMPATMGYPAGTQVWLPMPDDSVLTLQPVFSLQALARLRPGVTGAQAKAQLDLVAAAMAHQQNEARNNFDYRVESLRPEPQPLRSFNTAMAGVALLVLLVACFNLANLMLARGLGRRREIAVRMAVGASGAAIVRYVLTECAVFSVLGGAWGVLVSIWGVGAAERYMPTRLAAIGFVAPHLNWSVVAIGLVTTTATVVLVGLVPALRARRTNVNEAMKDGGASSTGHSARSHNVLAIVEVALSLVVLMTAGLLLRAAHAEESGKTWGYDVDHLLGAATRPGPATCATAGNRNYLSNLAATAAGAPDVRWATATQYVGLAGRRLTSDMPGIPVERNAMSYTLATPDYFRTYGIRITQGRDFVAGDVMGSGVAIIDRITAARLWPLQSPIGRMLKLGAAATRAPWVRVVGVTGSVNDLSNPDATYADMNVVVVMPSKCATAVVWARVKGAYPKTPVAIYHALRAALPGGFVGDVTSPRADFEQIVASNWLVAALFSAVGLFALALTAVGVYGVLSYSVSQRMREFAMRVALGAQNGDLFEIVWHDALVMVLAGTGVGAFGALWFAYLVRGAWLSGIQPTDVVSLMGAEAALMLVGLAACLSPVRQAMRADPVDLLRAT